MSYSVLAQRRKECLNTTHTPPEPALFRPIRFSRALALSALIGVELLCGVLRLISGIRFYSTATVIMYYFVKALR